jgi:hypothetical protein
MVELLFWPVQIEFPCSQAETTKKFVCGQEHGSKAILPIPELMGLGQEVLFKQCRQGQV